MMTCRHLLVHTLNEEEVFEAKRSFVMQVESEHELDGTQRSALPVSKQVLNCFAGVPRSKTP